MSLPNLHFSIINDEHWYLINLTVNGLAHTKSTTQHTQKHALVNFNIRLIIFIEL